MAKKFNKRALVGIGATVASIAAIVIEVVGGIFSQKDMEYEIDERIEDKLKEHDLIDDASEEDEYDEIEEED